MELDQIVILVKQKDKRAERALFNLTAPKILMTCKRYSKDDAEAKDLFQECFIKMFENINKYNPEKGHFEAWFNRLSINYILEQKRKQKKIKWVDVELAGNHEWEEANLEKITDKELLAAIRKLPPGYKDILNLFVFEKLSHKEIATLLNIKESTSRSQFVRAKKMLKKILIQSIPNIYERSLV